MEAFPTDQYGSACTELLNGVEAPPLGPGTPNQAAFEALQNLTTGSIFGDRATSDREMANCCRSGMWLLYNYLDESHQISQSISSSSGSYWHGIMHRREPDFSNSKYWFRRVGNHPIFPELNQIAAELASGQSGAATFLQTQTEWDPFRFVDLCQESIDTGSPGEKLCREIALAEWHLLFAHCYESALE